MLGPVASALTDFQMIRHQVLPSNRNNMRPNANPPIPPNQNNLRSPQLPNARNLFGEPSNRRAEESNRPRTNNSRLNLQSIDEQQQPQLNANNNNNDDDVQNRLQRNLHLRSRRPEPDMFNMPKRFNESSLPSHDRIAMAAFNDSNADGPSTSNMTSPRERRLQSLRRMEEKMQAIRQVNAPDPIDDQPAPQKRIKRNCIGLFVCDISNILLAENPFIEWVEHKNFGHISNAPERLILSSLVAGNGELIMFGGLRKESLSKSSDTTMQVSNAMHFLTVPKEII